MSLKFALLGLISMQPSSGYDLKRTIERSIYYIWNATSPQIYSTLTRLRQEGYITSELMPQQGRPDKQVHTITPSGQRALNAFAGEPIRTSVTRDEVLLRIFLGNFADEAQMQEGLVSYLARIREERDYLEGVEARILAHPGPKSKARKFQLLSLRLKLGQLRATEDELRAFTEREGHAAPTSAGA